jgi:hypothetical protein
MDEGMTAICGSMDPAHRSRRCPACDKQYKQRAKAGAPYAMFHKRSNPAVCIVCSLAAGNSMDIGVYRYPLKRWSRKKARWIGSVGLCDVCLAEGGELKPEYRRAA